VNDIESLRFHGDSILRPGIRDFAVNVWPAQRSKKLRRALLDALETHRYPDEIAARTAVARRAHRPVAEILLTNGAADAFWLLAQTLRPRNAACIHPSFTEPEAALRAAGAAVTRVFRDHDDFRLDVAAVPDDADLVVVCNPNNPTGNLDPVSCLEQLARPGRIVVVDEAFMDFARTSRHSLLERRDLTAAGYVVVRSFTKLWGLAGLRAGFLTADDRLVARLAANRQPWSVNAIACAAIKVCANDRTTRKQVSREVYAARTALHHELDALPGVRVWPSDVNFLLVKVPDGTRIAAALFARGFAVRPASSFPGLSTDHLRITIRTPEENTELVAALADVLATPAADTS
jgi:histidinol-phosphate/aromatic aminotransferase/cobyric acid decarboxylase-like protein